MHKDQNFWEDKNGHVFYGDEIRTMNSNSKPKIDPNTKFEVGSQVCNDYYQPKIEQKDVLDNDFIVDEESGFVVGSQAYNEYYYPENSKSGKHR